MHEPRDNQAQSYPGNAVRQHHIAVPEAVQPPQASAESALRAVPHFAESLVETIREPLVVLDATLRIVLVNRAFYRTFKVSRTDTEHRLFYELGNQQWNIPALRELLEDILPANTHFDDFEVDHTFPHIGRRVMLLNARRVLDGDTETRLILLAIEDITERRQMEEERKRLEDHLQQTQKMEALGTLAGGIAHEFNNILAGVLGFTQLLQREVPAESRAGAYVEQVRQASQRAKELVQQIITFSRTESDSRKPLQLGPVLREVLSLLRVSLPATVSIQEHIPDREMTVYANPTHIHQVMMNLCLNADYVMRTTGGILTVRVDAVEVDDAFAADHPPLEPGPHVRTTVSDTGEGIAPDILGRIFEPFFTTKGIGEGTGMGLAIVHGIVTSHEGAITVNSSPGVGTTVAIYLPRMTDGATSDAEPERPLPRGQGCVLVVDDEEPVTLAMQLLLEWCGYDVVTHTASPEALEVFRAAPHRFDVVITDQTMPQMTGAQLAGEVHRIRPDLPVILCTGFSHTIDAAQAQALGIEAFLLKPVEETKLVATIQQVLAQRLLLDE